MPCEIGFSHSKGGTTELWRGKVFFVWFYKIWNTGWSHLYPQTWFMAFFTSLILHWLSHCEGLKATRIPEGFVSDTPVYGYKAVWKSVRAFDSRESVTISSICYDFACWTIIISELCQNCIARKQLKCCHKNHNEGDLLCFGEDRVDILLPFPPTKHSTKNLNLIYI